MKATPALPQATGIRQSISKKRATAERLSQLIDISANTDKNAQAAVSGIDWNLLECSNVSGNFPCAFGKRSFSPRDGSCNYH
jgi:hypothetical protein